MADNGVFKALTAEQRRCDHHFEEKISVYDPEQSANIVCSHCAVRYADYAHAEVVRLQQIERVWKRTGKKNQNAKDGQNLTTTIDLDSDSALRTLLVWDVQGEAKRRLLQAGGNVMYYEARSFRYAVLLPIGTRRKGMLFILPNDSVLHLTPSNEGIAHGDTLIYAPLQTALHASRDAHHEVRHYGPVGRRANRSESQTGGN